MDYDFELYEECFNSEFPLFLNQLKPTPAYSYENETLKMKKISNFEGNEARQTQQTIAITCLKTSPPKTNGNKTENKIEIENYNNNNNSNSNGINNKYKSMLYGCFGKDWIM